MRHLNLLILLPFIVLFALVSEDPDAKECTDSGGVVEVDTYPHQPEYHRCELGGTVIKVWKHVDGKNVLVWEPRR